MLGTEKSLQYREEMSLTGDYESDEEVDFDESHNDGNDPSKRRKLNEDERVQRW
jgi:hypothetical protein